MPTFTPDELKKIAPDEYARIYGEDKPEKPDDETERLNAETRLLRARRLNAREKERQTEKPTRSPAPSGAWWIALAVAIAQFIFAWYIIAKY